MAMQHVGRIVKMVTTQGAEMGTGKALSFTEHPTIVVEIADGSQKSWSAELIVAATPDEIVAYWERRAYLAEALLDRLNQL